MLKTLVVVFLRGGADGLTLVPPVGDDDYHRARPRLAVGAREAIALDGAFGLHPKLAPLERLYRDGVLAVVPACGSEDDTRSHFEAQDLIERGGTDVAGGWLGRWLRRGSASSGGALAAVAFGTALPESLRGAPGATVVRTFEGLGLGADAGRLARELARLYEDDPLLAESARDAEDALRRLASLRESDYRPEGGAVYGTDDFALALRRMAQLLKAGVGLEAACLDLPGWDTHFVQDTAMDPLMLRLGSGLAAFCADLGPRLAETGIVVMTEFGRRVYENASLGTDHGRGGVMFILGGGVRGGVHGRWPGLGESALEGPGDVAVAQNYRDVLAPVLSRHAGAFAPEKVFPGYALRPLAI